MDMGPGLGAVQRHRGIYLGLGRCRLDLAVGDLSACLSSRDLRSARLPWSPVSLVSSSSSQALPARARQQHDFGGATVQFVQIGLGTNTTFIQNFAGPWRDWSEQIDWLSKARSETHPDVDAECCRMKSGECCRMLIWHMCYLCS